MYGENYGYRSSLNSSMVNHLENKIKFLEKMVSLNNSDLVIDIGSNDATSLKAYSGNHLKVGIDPTGKKFKKYYSDDITLICDFFTETCSKGAALDCEQASITQVANNLIFKYFISIPLSFVFLLFICVSHNRLILIIYST